MAAGTKIINSLRRCR